jgi:uncharacterized protein
VHQEATGFAAEKAMPANLTAIYKTAEATYKAAVTREERVAALEEMLRVIPKHKGTEKLQADLRSRLSKLKKEPAKKGGGARGPSHRIPAEGAGQVVLVGPPNAGKSALVARLTKADPEVADYPMTTREATPGMMPYGDVAFQLIDLPPLCDEHVEPWVYDLVRAADLAWVVLSLDDPLGGLEIVERLLGAKAIGLLPVTGDGLDEDRGVQLTPAEATAGRRPGWTYLPGFLVVTGADRPGAADDLDVLDELLGGRWPRVGVSALTGAGMAVLGDRTFDALRILRVYTKEPGHEPDMSQPFTLPIGATVGDLARAIHGEVAEQLKSARVWGPSAFDGQRVNAAHPLADGDVIELRT